MVDLTKPLYFCMPSNYRPTMPIHLFEYHKMLESTQHCLRTGRASCRVILCNSLSPPEMCTRRSQKARIHSPYNLQSRFPQQCSYFWPMLCCLRFHCMDYRYLKIQVSVFGLLYATQTYSFRVLFCCHLSEIPI